MKLTFHCARQASPGCLRSFDVDEGELTGDSGGDPALLPVVVPPAGWLPDPDATSDDAFICKPCATPGERAADPRGDAPDDDPDDYGSLA